MSERVTLDARAHRFQTRSAGILALLGTVLTIIGQLLQQRADIPRGDPLGVFGYIDGKPWFVAALLGVFGMLCWAAAFVAAGHALRDPISRSIARMAEPLLVVATVLFAVNYAHDGFSSGMLAQQWTSGELDPDAATAAYRVVEILVGGVSTLSQALVGLALAVYALAMLRSRQYPRVLSWLGIVGTVGWFLAGSALFLRLPGSSFELLLPFSGLATVWVLGVGITLLRRNFSDVRLDPS
ncbi:hypothetical protein FHR84_004071 [Actinopolyspora biskrensis]|uniref:DUF4386 domain-containing protein n=1 Tax=Actinopolyspora biskrensis TaxID=1470178 RepID=A0A852Z5V2_9ACTN|nr:DUF4386 family protein [Actinopolyspora biskrensis]NYH80705.1 hypothetical protein [Actinopolyspora biskrensis]